MTPVRTTTQEPALIELSLRPSLDFVTSIRRFVTDVYEKLLVGAGDAARIGIATHELLENAVRCSIDGSVHLRIDVGVGKGAAVSLRTINQAHAADLEQLRVLVAAMHQAQDPLAHYTQLMRQSAARPTGSGLGLARIYAECDLALSCDIEDDLVIVTANGFVDRL